MTNLAESFRTYHAHIYFKLEEIKLALGVQKNLILAIPKLKYVGKLIPMPIGPHPKPMFEIHIPGSYLEDSVAKIEALRENLSVLIHPVQKDELDAHTNKAIWLGNPLHLNLTVFDA